MIQPTPQAGVEELAELASAVRLSIAGLVGLAVGIEREWSGHASGPQGRFAGVRTFFLLGLVGGGAGILFELGYSLGGMMLLAGSALFVGVAYVMAVRRPTMDLDGTTETAALVVLTLGALAGLGQMALAGGAVAVVVFALGEKERVHWLVRHIGEREMRAALQFSVLALAVLPMLPPGPYGPFGVVRPRALWGIVLALSGLNFIGYLARRAVGVEWGYGLTGLLGGIVSSKLVTLQFSRLSAREPAQGRPLAVGVIAAATVMLVRVGVIGAALAPTVGIALAPYIVPAIAIGVAITALGLRRHSQPGLAPLERGTQSPLRLWSAVQMAVIFQAAILGATALGRLWGASGVLTSAAVIGMADIDALTVSMAHIGASTDAASLAARGIAVGILASLVLKLSTALLVGRGAFRKRAAQGIGALMAVLGASWWIAGRISG